jgi:tetratricopeptide (TPR) repeat protein
LIRNYLFWESYLLERVCERKKVLISVRKITLRVFIPLVVLLLLVAGSRSQPLHQKSGAQKRFENETTSKDQRVADAYYHLGLENLHEPSNSDRAIEHLEKAIDLDATNAEYHYMLAEAYMANSQYASLVRVPFLALKVKAQLELAVQHDPASTIYREALVHYYVFAPAILGGSFQKAHAQADQIARMDSYLGALAHAGVYAEEGEGDKAVDLYKKAIYSRPSSWQAYQYFGKYYLENHEVDAAISMFRKYVDVAPDQAESYHQLGQAYQQKRMYAEAIEAFQKSLDLDPSRTPLVFRIAQLQEFRGNRVLAREQYQRYLTMVPGGRAADDARTKIRELAR